MASVACTASMVGMATPASRTRTPRTPQTPRTPLTPPTRGTLADAIDAVVAADAADPEPRPPTPRAPVVETCALKSAFEARIWTRIGPRGAMIQEETDDQGPLGTSSGPSGSVSSHALAIAALILVHVRDRRADSRMKFPAPLTQTARACAAMPVCGEIRRSGSCGVVAEMRGQVGSATWPCAMVLQRIAFGRLRDFAPLPSDPPPDRPTWTT